MPKRQRDCARCGAPVGYLDRVLCCRCIAADRRAAARSPCPRCARLRVLDPGTGRCIRCSRCCTSCGHPVMRRADTLCGTCRRRAAAAAAKAPCPRCSRMRVLRPGTGWCASCSHPGSPPLPPRTCPRCSATTTRLSNGMCSACWQAHPDRPFTRAATLADGLDEVPDWLDGFVAHVAAVFSPSHAAGLVGQLGRLLADGSSTHPQALLDRSRRSGRSIGTLARCLQDYFTTHALALPGDHDRARAAGRRQRRIDAVPEPLRPAVAGFADSLLASGQRAQRARTRPRSDSTIDSALGTIRDLATFLHADGKDDWALAAHGDIEGFLAARGPGSRPRALTVVRQFCRWARARKLILVDPTRAISIRRPRGFTGQTLGIARQRELFTRWTTDPHVHPNEALAGLLALLHGASSQEIRELTERDVDLAAGTMRIGRRPHPTPVDPITQDAIRRCVEHRRNLATANPHLLVTRGTKADSRPASAAYLRHLFDPVGHAPKDLRVTRLAELARTMDPKLVADAFGLNHQGVLCYVRDTVDPGRLPAELANPSAFGAT